MGLRESLRALRVLPRPRRYPGVVGRIHPRDDMKHAEDLTAAHYVKVGRSAVENIGAGLAAAGRGFDDVEACLDMPCLDDGPLRRLLRLFSDILAPGGVVVVTTHGQLPWKGSGYEAMRDEIETGLRTRGFAYVPYEGTGGEYGHAWHTRDYVRDAFASVFSGSARLVMFRERGWDDHQDVFAFQPS